MENFRIYFTDNLLNIEIWKFYFTGCLKRWARIAYQVIGEPLFAVCDYPSDKKRISIILLFSSCYAAWELFCLALALKVNNKVWLISSNTQCTVVDLNA